ncbi:MAG: DUF2846 domain-containing protein [Thermoanaerobaculia bacterium]
MKRRILFLCVLAVVLTAVVSCASGARFSDLQPKTAPERLESGRVFFYRPSSLGAALRPTVKLNGESVGKAVAQGFFYVDRPPGEYEVITETEVKRKVSFVLEKGHTRYIRFAVSMGFFVGHVYGQVVDPDVAMNEIKQCKYTGTQ